MKAKLGVISEICCTFAMTINFRFPKNGPSKAVWGIFLFLMQRYKIFMTLVINSLGLFELICDYPYLTVILFEDYFEADSNDSSRAAMYLFNWML